MYVKPISKIMPAIKYINRLLAIDQMIRLRLTGSPKQLAEKLELSERQVYTYLNNLKELGAEIKFDKCINSYLYTVDIKLVIAYEKIILYKNN
jgi:predicted DNA-binding transcriptional regulator YafY